MKAVILAGGLGTRISEETHLRPKPMIEIGGKPILWHILKIYSYYGVNKFIICCGYKGYVIKEYFSNYFLHMSDVTIDMSLNEMKIHRRNAEPWEVTLVDTGEYTMTGGRIKRIEDYVDGSTFCLTYGDGVSDVNIKELINHHYKYGRSATLTAVQPPGRYGALNYGDTFSIKGFEEKPQGDGSWVNGGYFVLEPSIFDKIDGDECVWEQAPLTNLASNDQLTAYIHKGFWQPMDTLRDLRTLESLWTTNKAPWKLWK